MAPYRFHPGISFQEPAVPLWVKDVTRLIWHFISESCQRGLQLTDTIFLSGGTNVKSSSESADGKFVNDFAYAKKKGRGVDRKVCKKFSPFCWKVRLFWFFSNLFRGISFYRFMHLRDLPLPPLPPSQILWRSRAWRHSSVLCPFVDKR